MTYTSKTIKEVKETLDYFGKDTQRKRKIFVNKWIADNNYILDHIEPQIKENGFAWHLGQKMYSNDLRAIKQENALLIKNFDTIIN